MITMIFSICKDGAIGKNNDLICRVKEDMQHFVKTTKGNVVVMGRKTFESMNSKPLKDRKNIIITSKVEASSDPDLLFMNMDQFKSWYFTNYMDKDNHVSEGVYVIGGLSIYKEFAKYCEKMIVTYFDYEDKEADTFIDLDKLSKNFNLSCCRIDKLAKNKYGMKDMQVRYYKRKTCLNNLEKGWKK